MIVVLLTLFAGVAHAEWPITYEDALTHAVKANPTLARSRVARDDAQGAILGARGLFDPHFVADSQLRNSQSKGFFQGFPFDANQRTWRTSGGLKGQLATGATYSVSSAVNRNLSTYLTKFAGNIASESIQDAFTAQVDVSITQPILEGWRFSYQLRHVTRARSNYALAELRVEAARQRVLFDAASAYWSWLYLLEVERIAEDAVIVAQDAYGVGAERLQVGELAAVELSRLDAARAQAKMQRLDAHISREQAEDALLMVMGQPTDASIVPASALENAPVHAVVIAGEVVEVAMAQNLELLIKRAEMEQARVDRKNAQHERLPSLSVTLGTGRGSQVVASPDVNANVKGAVTGLWGADAYPYGMVSGQLDVPLGNRASRSAAERAGLAVKIKQIELSELERRVASEVQLQVMRLDSGAEKVRLAELNRTLAQLQLNAEESFIQTGAKRMRDVLQARNELRRTTAELAKARADARLATAELLRLTGQLDRE